MIRSSSRLELYFWASVPGLIAFFLLILCLAPKHMEGLSGFMPALPLIPIFYWGMLHAREMPYWLVFTLGLVMDAGVGAPLGLSSLTYLIFLAMLRAQRKYIHKEGFIIKWGYFGLLLLMTCLLNWMCMSLHYARLETLLPALIQWALTMGCYPLLHRMFDGLYRYINDRRWQLLHG